MDLSIIIYLFTLMFMYFLLLLTYCFHPVLIITCILNQIVYIKPFTGRVVTNVERSCDPTSLLYHIWQLIMFNLASLTLMALF